jgi:hypothetical protein
MNKLLELGEPIFQRIKQAVHERKYSLAYQIIQNTPPPPEWVVELPSKSKKGETYKTIPLDIMEGAMKVIFNNAQISSISSPTITQDKSGRFAVTVQVNYVYISFDEGQYEIPGIATVAVNDIQLLEMATPKASSMAVKNAIKQLGDLFGKSLNKSEDELEIPEQSVEQEATPEQLSSQLVACNSLEELKSYRLVVYSKGTPLELQDLYETRLRKFKNN